MSTPVTNGVITQADGLLVEFRNTLTGSVVASTTTARTPRGTARLSKAGEWSLALPMTAYDPTTMGIDQYVTVSADMPVGADVVLFRGRVDKVKQEFTKGIRWVRLSGADQLGSEWGTTEIIAEEIYDTVVERVAAVAREYWQSTGAPGNNASEFMPEANDDDTGTAAVLWLVDNDPSNFPEHLEDVAVEHIYLYVGHVAPFDQVHFDFNPAWVQGQVATLQAQQFLPATEWTWITLTGNTTVVSGKPLAQDGIVSFDKAPKEIPLTHAKANLYWVRFYHTGTGADLDGILIQEIKVRTAGPATNDIQQVMTKCAPAGWTLHASSPTSTARKHQMSIIGENALRALVRLAEHSGENFALTNTTEIRWMTSPISSGITAKEIIEEGDSASSCYITDLQRVQERRELVTRVYLEGSGDDPDAAVNLNHLRAGTYTLPSGYAIAGKILAHTALEGELGKQIQKRLKFPDIGALWGGTGGNPQAALELLKAGLAYLDIHKEHSEHFTATLTGINKSLSQFHPGMTMVVKSAVYDANGGVTENINKTLVVVEVTRSMDLAGNISYDVVLGKQAEYVPAAAYLSAMKLLKDSDRDKHFQASSGLRLVQGGGAATGGSGGGGGGGGVDAVTFAEHVAETFDAHEIPAQIDAKVATHAALTTTAHNIPSQIDAKIATHTAIPNAHHNPVTVTAPITVSGQLVGLDIQNPLTVSGGNLGLKANTGLEVVGGDLRIDVGPGMVVIADGLTVNVGGGIHIVSGVVRLNLGNGLEIFGTALQINLAVSSGLEFVDGELRVARNGGIATGNNGLFLVPSTLTATTTNGTSGTGHTHAITATADAHALVSALLKADDSGHIKLRSITIHNDADIGRDLAITRDITTVRNITTTGDVVVGDDLAVTGDVDVTANTTTGTLNTTGNADLYGSTLRARNGRVGVNREPDPQFAGDVEGALRATWLVGPHALQIADATMILNLDRSLTGHRGQVPIMQAGSILYRRGKFNEGLVAYPSLTNLCVNPSFETNTTGWASFTLGTISRVTDQSYAGGASLLAECSGGATEAQAAYHGGLGTLDASASYSARFAVRNRNTPATNNLIVFFYWQGGANANAYTAQDLGNIGSAGKWREFSATFQADYSDRTAVWVYVAIGATSGQGFWLDGMTIVKQAYIPPIFDGTMPGCAWTGTAHASTSTYAEPTLVYNALPPVTGDNDRISLIDTLNDVEGTVMFWVNMAAVTSANNRYLVYLENDDDGVAVALYLSTTGKVVAVVNGDVTTGATTITTGWILVGMDYGEANGVRVFLNGVLDASDSYSPPNFKQDATFRVLSGPAGFTDNNPLIGMADMGLFASRQLEEIEHRAIYESNAPVFAYVSISPSGGGTNAGGRYSLDDGGLQFFNPAGEKTGHLKITEGGEYLEVNGINVLTPTDDNDPPPFNRLRFVDQDGNPIFQILQDFFTTRLVNESADWTQAGMSFRAVPSNGTDDVAMLIGTQNGGGGWVEVVADAGFVLYADSTLFRAAHDGLKYENGGLTYKNNAANTITVGDPLADENWITPSLSNSWVNFDGTKSSAGYRKTARGTVVLKGVLKNGSSATATMFTLPSGYRPSQTRRYPAAANSALGIVEVTTGGAISFVVGGSTTQSSLDGIEIWL